MKRLWPLLVLTGCFDFSADLVTCRGVGRCACPVSAFPPPTKCGNDTDVFLSASGDDANNGASESAPRRTLGGITLGPGHRIHLAAGTWIGGLHLSGDGRADCAITVDGAPDGGTLFVTDPNNDIRVFGSHWRISDLSFEASGSGSSGSAINVSGGMFDDVTFQRITGYAVGMPQALVYFDYCTDCAVVASRFEAHDGGQPSNVLQAWSCPRFSFRGNRVETDTVVEALIFKSASTDARVEGNEFIGSAAADFEPAGGIFERNLVHDVRGAGTLVKGAARVSRNTFAQIDMATAANTGEFTNNLVWIAGVAFSGSAPVGGGFNLFETVQAPYGSGDAGATDVVALPQLGANFVPTTGSPAIDAADPALPVPTGGGKRADIGAFEVGASVRPDGTFCPAP